MSILLSIILIILSASHYLFIKKEGSIKNWREFYNAKEINYDVLIVGSSIAYSSFKSNLISAKLNTSSFNLSSPSINVKQLYYNVNEAIKYNKPQLLVVEAHSLDIENSDEGKMLKFNFQNIDGQKNSINKIKSIVNVFKSKNWIDAMFPTVRNHHEWANFDLVDRNLSYTHTNDENLGYKPLKTDDSKNRIAKTIEKTPETYTISDENSNYFQKIVNLCKKENIKLLLVRSPQIQYQSDRKYCKQIFEKTKQLSYDLGFDYIDYNYKYEEIGFEQTDFYDALHLNDKGANKLTLKFITDVSKKVDLVENKNLVHREAEYYLEENRFLNARKILTKTFVPKEGIYIDQIFIKETVKDEYCFFIGFNPNSNIQELKKYKIAIQLIPVDTELHLLENEIYIKRKMISLGNYSYPLYRRDNYLIKPIGFKKIIPKNFKRFRVYLYNKEGVSEKIEISNFKIDVLNENINNSNVLKLTKSINEDNHTEEEEVSIEKINKSDSSDKEIVNKSPLVIIDTEHTFQKNLVFKQISIYETSSNTYEFMIEIEKNKTDLEELKKWKLAMQVFPENPEELENFKKNGKDFSSKGLLINPKNANDKVILHYKNIKIKPNRIKLLRFYLYGENNKMIDKYFNIRNITLSEK